MHLKENYMEKKKIRAYQVIYGVNTGVKYIKSDGTNRNYIYVKHKHEDYEIRIITKGKGYCSIGEDVLEYKSGDIFFIGKNVPHCSSLYELSPEDNTSTESIILQFVPDLIPSGVKEVPDFFHISNLLKKGQNGLLFRERNLYRKIKKIAETIDFCKGVRRVNELFYLLEILGRSKHLHLISKETYESQNKIQTQDESLQKVFDFLYNNMKEEVMLESIAAHVHLNPAALCRSFKRKTGVTLFRYLNKIRIENACRLLSYTELTISQIAYESGFNNIPHFNRQFKLITNTSPSDYRSRIEKVEE